MSEEETAASTWLTVAEAAASAGVSERAIQKRAAAGKIGARRRETPQGVRWEIAANEIARTAEPVGREPANEPPEPNQRTAEPPEPTGARTPEPERELQAGHAQSHANARTERDANQRTEPREPPEPGREPTPEPANHAPDFTAHLLAENKFLRAALEARDRDAAELRAALRESLKISTRALTAGPAVEVEREEPQVLAAAQDAKQSAAEAEQVGAQAQSEPRRGAVSESGASTWERAKGLRGWLLRMLRGEKPI